MRAFFMKDVYTLENLKYKLEIFLSETFATKEPGMLAADFCLSRV